MQAIQVHYRANDNTARAFCAAGSIILPVDDFRTEAIVVAKALQKKLGWDYSLVEGCLQNGDPVFVQLDEKTIQA